MPVDQRFRKGRRAVVNVDVGHFLVTRYGELNGGRPVFQAIADRKSFVIVDIILIVEELLASAQNVNRVGL